MKKILGLTFAGAMLIACGGSNRNASGMQGGTTPAQQNAQGATGTESYGGTNPPATGMENQQGTQQEAQPNSGMENQQGTQPTNPNENMGNPGSSGTSTNPQP